MSKKFIFDEKGVCTNPDIDEYKFKYGKITIKTAMGKKGRWTRDVSYMQSPTCGGGMGYCFFNDAAYTTKAEAVNDALIFFKRKLEYELSVMLGKKWETNEWGDRVEIKQGKIGAYRHAISNINSRLTGGIQLTLFQLI